MAALSCWRNGGRSIWISVGVVREIWGLPPAEMRRIGDEGFSDIADVVRRLLFFGLVFLLTRHFRPRLCGHCGHCGGSRCYRYNRLPVDFRGTIPHPALNPSSTRDEAAACCQNSVKAACDAKSYRVTF